jgi:N-acetyl-alpha-D-glucosaminyl L-malate synthase BshA
MNIGFVLYPTFGGSGVVATELGKALAEMGHQIHFITYREPVRLSLIEENVFYHEVNVTDYALFDYQPYALALSSKLVDVVKKEKLELLHVHYAIPHAYAAYMSKKMLADEGIHLPVVTTLHGTDITLVGKNPSYRPAVSFSINHSDEVTAVSQNLRDETYEFFKIKKEIHVIPNFIDFDFYTDSLPCIKRRFARRDQRLITHISNFRPVKRVEDVIRVFEQIQQEVDAILLMVGDGPERAKAENLAAELGLSDKIQFPGKTKDISRVLNCSDLFLLPSETESFGLAALEAMACRTPVISSNTGGLPEVNEHGHSGYTCEVGDVDSMAKYAMEILSDQETLDRFKENAFKRSKDFDQSNVVPLYLEVYNKALRAEG